MFTVSNTSEAIKTSYREGTGILQTADQSFFENGWEVRWSVLPSLRRLFRMVAAVNYNDHSYCPIIMPKLLLPARRLYN